MTNLEKDKNERFKYQFLYGKHFILTPFKGTENRVFFSVSCLVCATELNQYTNYVKSALRGPLIILRSMFYD